MKCLNRGKRNQFKIFSTLKNFILILLISISNNLFASISNEESGFTNNDDGSNSLFFKSIDLDVKQNQNIRENDIEFQLTKDDFQGIQASIKITGKVTDKEGQLLPGVTIQIKNTDRGVATDVNGHYEILVDDNSAILVFSFIGYKTLEIPVSTGSTIDVAMEEEIHEIDDVVVTALGITRKAKSLVYATQKVDAEGIKKIKDPNNVLNSLQGKVANALITQSSGGVGSGAQIILRGNKSIQGSNSALIVVDGVPIYNSTYNNGATNINSDDIESLTVLRGPSAAALYGSQAGNGVLVITTKKGKKDKFIVELNHGLTFEKPFVLPDFQNTYGQGSNGVINSSTGDSWGSLMEDQQYLTYLGDSATYSPQPNNVSDFFNNGTNVTSSVSFSGGTEKNQVYFSFGNTQTQGIIPNNNLERNNVSLRVNSSVSDKFSVDLKLSYFKQTIEFIPRSGEGNTPVLDIYQIPRSVSTSMAKQYQTYDNLGIPTPNVWPSTVSSIYGNPYWVVNNDRQDKTQDQFMGFVTLKYQLFDWLSLSGRVNMERSFHESSTSVMQGTLLYGNSPGGAYYYNLQTNTQQWADFIIDGHNKIGEKITASYQAGAIYRDTKNEIKSISADGLSVTNKFDMNYASSPVVGQEGSQVQIQSFFGTASFSYNNNLFLEGSFRNDWDSRLPSPHSFQYYSVGASAILSNMVTLPSFIPFLKTNLNYAEVGNGGQFALLTPSYFYEINTGSGALFRNSVYPFPGLKPEIVRSLEASIDAKFLNNRLGLTATVYKSNSFNQLIQINIPVATEYSSKYINAGNIQNKGLELTLTGTPIKTNNFLWDVGLNYSMNRNKVISLSENVNSIDIGIIDLGGRPEIKVGGSYGDLTAYRWATDDNGNYLVSSSGKPVTTNQLGMVPEKIGNFNPKGIFGLTNTFTYKRFVFNALVTGRIGGVMISGTEMNLAFSGITKATEKFREGGLVLGGVDSNGDPIDTEITSQQFWQAASYKRFGIGEFFAYDITNVRLKELSLGFDIPVGKVNFIKNARISLVANNLLWIYRGKSLIDIPGMGKRKFWFDPDVSLYNGNASQGVEYGAFPSTTSIGYNLSITL